MLRLYRSRASRRVEKADNEEKCCRGYTDQGPARKGRIRIRTAMKREDSQPIRIEGPLRQEKGDSKERGC